jgi:AraC-like DNA-binding protein
VKKQPLLFEGNRLAKLYLTLLSLFIFTNVDGWVNSLNENVFIHQINEITFKVAIQSPETGVGLSTQSKNDKELAQEFRLLSQIYSDSLQAERAIYYAEKYIRYTEDLSIINDHYFFNIKNTDTYLNFKNRYEPHFSLISMFYLFAGFLGLFIFVILNVKRGINRKSTFLISLFVLLHSLFIIHLSLYLINYHYYFPHALLMSTVFTLCYGPLIYFYFKITATDYKLKVLNLVHLIPAILLLIYIFPFYTLSAKEKFIILFNQEDILLSEANYIMITKIISLIAYAILTINIYRESKKNVKEKSRKLLWQRNIIAMYTIYVVTFLLFIGTTSGFLDFQIFFHLQIVVMVGLVFYVAYITYVQPEIFKGEVKLVDPVNLFKYRTSSLTPSYSNELKDNLLNLLNDEKIHRENNISLQLLSEKLGTSRHNTSQVINEHFNLNFFELINKYRIEDAVAVLNNNVEKNLTIIEIAYMVGFNNKVTFNKSFKKYLSQTPSEYIKSLR